MKSLNIIVALTALAFAEAAAAEPRLLVHLSRCSGPELKKEQVLLIDVSEAENVPKELKRVLEERQLQVIRERTIGAVRNLKSAMSKATKTAGKDRCDAVIVLKKRSEKSGRSPGCPPRGTGAYASVSFTQSEWLEVVFAEPKAAAQEAVARAENKEGSGGS